MSTREKLRLAAQSAFADLDADGGGMLVWRLEHMELVEIDAASYGEFFVDDVYVVLVTADASTSPTSPPYDVYAWLGAGSSADEQGAAAFVCVELDEKLGGKAVLHRCVQGHEPAAFCAAFGGLLEYRPGGVKTGRTHTFSDAQRLLRVHGRRICRVSEVALAGASLNASDVFVLDTAALNRRVVIWMGRHAPKQARCRALELVEALRAGHSAPVAVSVCEELGNSPPEFWRALGGEPSAIAPGDAAADAPAEADGEAKLVRLAEVSAGDGKKKLQVTEVVDRPLTRSLLDDSDAYLLVGSAGVWVWIGSNASKTERSKAMLYAQSYIKGKGRPDTTPIARIVQNSEHPAFVAHFHGWEVPLPPSASAAAAVEAKRLTAAALGADGALRVYRLLRSGEQGASHTELRKEDRGLFHRSDAYVVTWTAAGGAAATTFVHTWSGRASETATREAAARLAARLDAEAGGAATIVHCRDGHEPPHFAKLFGGAMEVRSGAAGAPAPQGRLFKMGGAQPAEASAVEVEAKATSLCSADCFALVEPKKSAISVWVGAAASDDERAAAAAAAGGIAERLKRENPLPAPAAPPRRSRRRPRHRPPPRPPPAGRCGWRGRRRAMRTSWACSLGKARRTAGRATRVQTSRGTCCGGAAASGGWASARSSG